MSGRGTKFIRRTQGTGATITEVKGTCILFLESKDDSKAIGVREGERERIRQIIYYIW